MNPQVEVELARLQTVPQPAQLESEFSCVSQPLPGLPSQLPQPLLQLVSEQVPLAQLAVAWPRLHAVPQVAQSVSVVSEVSHPFAARPSQFA